MPVIEERSGGDKLFARLQQVLPKHLLVPRHACAGAQQAAVGAQCADPDGAALLPADRHA